MSKDNEKMTVREKLEIYKKCLALIEKKKTKAIYFCVFYNSSFL